MTQRIVPDAGWHRGVSNEVYHEHWDAVNAGQLSRLAKSPMHLKWWLDNREDVTVERSKALAIGSAVHCAVLEPHELESRYACDPMDPHLGGYPKGWRNSNAYKAALAELVGLGFTPLPADDWDVCRRIRESVWSTPSHGLDLLDAADESEVSVVADDPVTGIRCKVRPDLVIRAGRIVGELKTTRSAETWSFERDLYQLGYFRAAPFYVDVVGWADQSMAQAHHVFLVVEKEPPFAFRTFAMDRESADERMVPSWELGRRSYRRLLDLYAHCMESGEWPGYPATTEPISIPGWAHRAEGERA